MENSGEVTGNIGLDPRGGKDSRFFWPCIFLVTGGGVTFRRIVLLKITDGGSPGHRNTGYLAFSRHPKAENGRSEVHPLNKRHLWQDLR